MSDTPDRLTSDPPSDPEEGPKRVCRLDIDMEEETARVVCEDGHTAGKVAEIVDTDGLVVELAENLGGLPESG